MISMTATSVANPICASRSSLNPQIDSQSIDPNNNPREQTENPLMGNREGTVRNNFDIYGDIRIVRKMTKMFR